MLKSNKLNLCKEKKFPDLDLGFDYFIKNNKLVGFYDKEGNSWLFDKFISQGSYGKVESFKSHNKNYVDLAVKTFFSLNKETYNELEMINFFNLNKCENFIKCEVINTEDLNLVIMEKIDGEVLSLRYNLFINPLKIYGNFVNFIISSFSCAYKKRKIFLDVKEENIGYKLCNKGIRFCLLDYGSFIDTDSKSDIATSTININLEAFRNRQFSNNILLVFGTTIMLLSQRLSVKNRSSSLRFNNFVDDLGKKKDILILIY